MSGCDVSVVLSTYNRAGSLGTALAALVGQRRDVPFEIIVVDNNSTDDTRTIVEGWREQFPELVRYVFEPQQGLPYARNAGIRAARAPLIAFTDDDVYVSDDWVGSIKRAFDAHPDVQVIGGMVLPRWADPPPGWFSKRLLAPLALQDKGTVPMIVDARNAAPCLIGANFAFRRELFDRVGLFDPVYTRAQDREIQLRAWRAGCKGLYIPGIVTWVDVPADRMTRQYFRMWHMRSGSYASKMRLLEWIDRDGALVTAPGTGRSLFGAPAYLYREVLQHARNWVVAALRRDEASVFYEECKLRFVASYIRERITAPEVASGVRLRSPRTSDRLTELSG